MSKEDQNLENAPPAEGSAFSEKAISTISGLRTRAQAAEMREAELIGKLSMVNATNAPPQKSPLEVRAEEEGVSVGEVALDGALYQAQKDYDAKIARNQAARESEDAAVQVRVQSKKVSVAKHPDWEQVIAAGEILLTKGEMLDLQNAGADFGEAAYNKCTAAIVKAKPKEDPPAPKKEPSEPETKPVPTQDEILEAAGTEDLTALNASNM
jgi:hypothetical protein